MIVIGLTGNIGSGKSTVARRLAELGAKIIDADKVARQVVMPGSPCLEEIAKEFGRGILNARGELDRKKMADVVFADSQARVRLNNIIHPWITREIRQEVSRHKNHPELLGPAGVLVVDAPLLIETGLQHNVDEVWVVKVNLQEQLRRLAKRDGLAPQEVMNRLDAQLPQIEKLKYARRVIDNSGTPDQTIKQVDQHWQDIKSQHPHPPISI
ncbi:dephospho-CoA kinase [Pelotomaculum propionicicum]|uniref:Dephospho-CoA kinase n=1 Tax=Pelotomaculum propionicicum TaxID=258475 RepID=A0A4Y7RML8_9FIRM|nr:dephospho-CoA kinase [Pelotomaculum propionicicum]TEB09547.1 Dephospho-CoA kinase [Pelotomaculum propionicicum]